MQAQPGHSRRGEVKVCFVVIACDKRRAFAQGSASDEAIHSFFLPLGAMDCFASLAMTAERHQSLID